MANLDDLNRELRGEAPPEFSTLAEHDLLFLTECLRKARKRQQLQLLKAMESALGHMPLLLRGPVKKILLG